MAAQETLTTPHHAKLRVADFLLLAGAGAFPDSARIAIEISDSTLDLDLGCKARLYVRCGVPEYWAVDFEGRVIRQMWAPSDDIYSEQSTTPLGAAATGATINRLIIETAAL